MNADEQTLASLNELETRLLADVELVRQMKARLGHGQPPPVAAVAVAAPASVPEIASPALVPPHPNRLVTDVKAALRTVIAAFSGEFGIGDP